MKQEAKRQGQKCVVLPARKFPRSSQSSRYWHTRERRVPSWASPSWTTPPPSYNGSSGTFLPVEGGLW